MMIFNNIFPVHYRLIFATLWGFLISTLYQYLWLILLNLIMLFILILQIKIYRKSYRTYCIKWVKLHLFSVVLLLSLSWQIQHNSIYFSKEGILLACLFILRINLLILSLWVILMNIHLQHLLQGINNLPLPAKLRYLFIFTVRYIHLLQHVNQTIHLAMKARGFYFTCNRRGFYVLSQRIALLFVHALNQIEKNEMALKARGFNLANIDTKNKKI